MEIKKRFCKKIKSIGMFIVIGAILGPAITHAYDKKMCERVTNSAIAKAQYLHKICNTQRYAPHCGLMTTEYPREAQNIANGIKLYCK